MAEANGADMTDHSEGNYGQLLHGAVASQSAGTPIEDLRDQREDMNSPRVQKCLDRAECCERAASILASPNAIATFLRAARSWREMAKQYRQRERTEALISARCPGSGPWVNRPHGQA
jgi:hypothetical protein